VQRSDAETGVIHVRHEAYHLPGRPYLDGIEWATNVRPTTQRYKLEAGEQDFCTDFVPTDIALFEADPAWAGRGRWISKQANNAIFMNTEIAPFDDRSVRRAVAFAVDPSVLARVRTDVLPIDRVLPDSVPGPDRSQPMRRHDLPAALAEMAKAGYPFDPATGRGGYPREIDYLTVPDSFEQASAEIYQQQLAKIGIRVRLHLVTFATYLAEVSRRRAAPMGWTGWRADFPDPSNFFEPTLSSKAIQDEGSQNRAFFANAELDDVLARAHGEGDRARRMALYERAEEIVRDEAPWVPTHVARSYQVWQPYLHGYEPHPFLPPRFDTAWLDPPAARVARSGGARRALGLLAPLGGDTPRPGGPR
jgi:ABC-type transport system substrate-binding protein